MLLRKREFDELRNLKRGQQSCVSSLGTLMVRHGNKTRQIPTKIVAAKFTEKIISFSPYGFQRTKPSSSSIVEFERRLVQFGDLECRLFALVSVSSTSQTSLSLFFPLRSISYFSHLQSSLIQCEDLPTARNLAGTHIVDALFAVCCRRNLIVLVL